MISVGGYLALASLGAVALWRYYLSMIVASTL